MRRCFAGRAGRAGRFETMARTHTTQVCCLSHLFCDIQLPQSVLEFNTNFPLSLSLPRCSSSSSTPAAFFFISFFPFFACANFGCISCQLPTGSSCRSCAATQVSCKQPLMTSDMSVRLSGSRQAACLLPLIGIDPQAVSSLKAFRH